jgi:hypothetical protein
LCFSDKRLAAHDTRHVQPVDRADGDENENNVAAEEHHQQDHEEHERHGVEDVDDAHHDVVHAPAEIARGGAPADADQEAHERRHHANEQRDAAAVERADEQVAAEGISAEDVPALPVRADGYIVPVGLGIVPGRQPWTHDHQHRHRQDERAGDHRRAVAPQDVPGVHPQAAALDRDRNGAGASGRGHGERRPAHPYFTLGSSQA